MNLSMQFGRSIIEQSKQYGPRAIVEIRKHDLVVKTLQAAMQVKSLSQY